MKLADPALRVTDLASSSVGQPSPRAWLCDHDRWRLCVDPVWAVAWLQIEHLGEHTRVAAPRWLAVALETGLPMGLEMGSPVGSEFFFVFFNSLPRRAAQPPR